MYIIFKQSTTFLQCTVYMHSVYVHTFFISCTYIHIIYLCILDVEELVALIVLVALLPESRYRVDTSKVVYTALVR